MLMSKHRKNQKPGPVFWHISLISVKSWFFTMNLIVLDFACMTYLVRTQMFEGKYCRQPVARVKYSTKTFGVLLNFFNSRTKLFRFILIIWKKNVFQSGKFIKIDVINQKMKFLSKNCTFFEMCELGQIWSNQSHLWKFGFWVSDASQWINLNLCPNFDFV